MTERPLPSLRGYDRWKTRSDRDDYDGGFEPPDEGEEEAEMTELTYGEQAVGLDFNPSGDPKVRELKQRGPRRDINQLL